MTNAALVTTGQHLIVWFKYNILEESEESLL